MITLTTEQAQQIDEVLNVFTSHYFEERHRVIAKDALATIRAARAHTNARSSIRSASEYLEHEPVAWQEVVSNVANNLGEMASQAHTQRFCDEINKQVDMLFSLINGESR